MILIIYNNDNNNDDGEIFKPIDAAARVLILAASIGLKIFNPRRYMMI